MQEPSQTDPIPMTSAAVSIELFSCASVTAKTGVVNRSAAELRFVGIIGRHQLLSTHRRLAPVVGKRNLIPAIE